MNKSDLLSKDEVFDVAGVKVGARNGLNRVMNTLKNAGIYFWIKADGNIGTTWHHVHMANASQIEKNTEQQTPNFNAIS